MGLMDFIKGELIEIIEWTDDSRDTLSFRFPDDDKAIKNGAQLIVRESQQVQFVYLGEFGDTFGPGKHTLTTDNIPILTKLKSWRYGFNSPFKADVYFLNTRLFTGNKWGTANPIMMRDNDLGIVRVRAFGTYDFRIVDPKLFLKEVAGSDHNFRLDEFADTMRSRVVSIFADALASAHVPVFDVASRYTELGEALLPIINPVITAKYGLEIPADFLLVGNQMYLVFALSILLVYLVLAAQYESWTDPLVVVLAVPMAIVGIVIALFVRRFPIDLYTQIGLVLIIALAAKNAILIVEYARQLTEEGMSAAEAGVEALRRRFRPILMTSLAFILGVVPLLTATGAGAASQQAIGTVVFGGMLASTLLIVPFVPVFFVAIRGLRQRRVEAPAPMPAPTPH